MPGTLKLERLTTPPGSDLRQLEIQYNNGVNDYQMACLAGTTDMVWGYSSAIAASGQALGRGGTDTNIGSGALRFIITGQAATEAKAAVAAGTALPAGTIPASTWGVYSLDIATGGTITVTAGAANFSTGYSSEALAIAALPTRVTAKARMGYVTVLASSSGFVGGTDALAGGASGNPATTTNYYPFDGAFAPTGQAYGPNGIVTAGPPITQASAWTAGRNGVLIPTVLSKGGTDTNLQSTAFTFNCNGVCNIAKGAVAAGTAFGSLGTIPAGKWGIIVAYINTAGTVTFQSGPANYTTGYGSEAAAIGDLTNIFPTATASNQVCRIGYITVKTKDASTAWIAGTDALAGGASGNPASVTNYYPTPGVTLLPGQTASLIANRQGTVIGPSQY